MNKKFILIEGESQTKEYLKNKEKFHHAILLSILQSNKYL